MKNKMICIILCIVMLVGMMPMTAISAAAEGGEVPVPVTTEGNTYSLFTAENLEGQFGTTFLYVVKRDGRYYTPAHPQVSGYAEVDSVAAVDITEYYDAQTNTFSGIPDSANVGVMEYQSYMIPDYGASGLFLDGNIMLSLSLPFEDSGETWFDGGIRYYDRHETYSYSRALWEATGAGSGYFYDLYSDWLGDGSKVYGVLALKDTDRFALRNFTEEYVAEETIDVSGYLYAAPCYHAVLEHSAYDAPTCMDKGCDEYWYCVYCDEYFADAECEDSIGHIPVLPALDHNYSGNSCSNCGQPTPAYTKITCYEQFVTVDPNASFIAVAEIDNGSGSKDYYVLKKEIITADSDIDEDGEPDILAVDENSNGVADILEIDGNGDGTADAMEFDGSYDGEPDGKLDADEIWEYLFRLENQYTDGYIAGLRTIGAIPVTPAQDGTISVKGLGALEWVMERTIPDSELDDQYYGDGATKKDYANDFRFRIPNFWIRPVVTVSNNLYREPYEQGDSKWWGVLFGKDVKALNDRLYEPLYDESYPDDAAILYTEGFDSINSYGQLEHALRFLINGEEKNFIMTSDSFWEELDGTVYPVYLYCSDAGGEFHEHVYGPWMPNTEETHQRVCTVEGCEEFEMASHTYGEECTPDLENPELGHWVTCTECGGEIHEYHTRDKYSNRYPNNWKDSGDGVHHVVYCTECEGPAAYEEHNWSEWTRNGQWDSESQTYIYKHRRYCTEFPCPAEDWREACIYDDGVATKEPSCTEDGITTYTCVVADCGFDTNTYTETTPALGHAWTDWTYNGEETHIRTCSRNCGVEAESGSHEWDEGVVTKEPTEEAEGEKTYTCAVCKYERKEAIEKLEHVHEWTEWGPDDNGRTHSQTCRCKEVKTEDHVFGNGEVTQEPSHIAPGEISYTCGICNYTKIEDIPMLEEHEWTQWLPDDNHMTHSRSCICGESQQEDHDWTDWAQQRDSIYQRKCTVCHVAEDLDFSEEFPVENSPVTNAVSAQLTNTPIELVETILTVQEQSQAAAGAAVSVYLMVEDITDSASIAEKTAIEAAAGQAQVGMYLDIDLFKKIDSAETQMTETNGLMTITIVIPDELISTDAAVNRVYRIVRVHEDGNGNTLTEVIEGVFDAENKTFTFQTDKFSTYALIYTDDKNVRLGDVNEDGEINVLDLMYLANYFAKGEKINKTNADVNADGLLDVRDLMFLANVFAGKESLG